MKFLKRIFCRHKYRIESRVSTCYQGVNIPYDSTYNFVCQKCGKLKWIRTYGRDDLAMEKEKRMENIKQQEIKVGMKVSGIFLGSGGYFMMGGTVIELGVDTFKVFYPKLMHTQAYRMDDMEETVFSKKEDAQKELEEMQNVKDEKEREDFAEQNSRPFGKI